MLDNVVHIDDYRGKKMERKDVEFIRYIRCDGNGGITVKSDPSIRQGSFEDFMMRQAVLHAETGMISAILRNPEDYLAAPIGDTPPLKGEKNDVIFTAIKHLVKHGTVPNVDNVIGQLEEHDMLDAGGEEYIKHLAGE